MVKSLKENRCPVCGHEQPIRRTFGDPETCEQCGHFTEPKEYPSPLYGWTPEGVGYKFI
jgi:ribosomal protein L37AE/L43A